MRPETGAPLRTIAQLAARGDAALRVRDAGVEHPLLTHAQTPGELDALCIHAIAIHQHGWRPRVEVDGIAELAVEPGGAPTCGTVEQVLRQLELIRFAAF